MFWLYDVPSSESSTDAVKEPEISREDFEAMLDAITTLANATFDGLPELLDDHEPQFDGERVWNHERLKPALDAYLESGFFSASFPKIWGGMGMPFSVAQALNIPVNAKAGTGIGYLFLTAAAANMLSVVGTEEQKRMYLPKLVSGQWFGTMMLSETQAGSSVGDIRTRAVLQPDGTYHLTGSKMWISGGDQELSANIIHMVLAKIDDGNGIAAGTGGISLFLVPKYFVNADGSLGARNGVKLAGVNHKMGHRGIVNTVPVLGADTPCVGQLLGQPGKGMSAMFHMMNEARIGIGMTAAQYGYFGYRYSLKYAQERTQGRSVASSKLSDNQVAIIEHTDVKRMLMQQKALSEGALALCFYAAQLVDKKGEMISEAARNRNSQLLAILTPIVKSWPSVWGLHANYLAIQVLGGYGYTRDFPVERIYRDNRLNEIHEGTTGIQSLDLLGRKVIQDGGVTLKLLLSEISSTVEQASGHASLQEFALALHQSIARIEQTTGVLISEAQAGRMERALANSVAYLDMCGHTVVAWMWLRMAMAAQNGLDAGHDGDSAFFRGKLRACQYFFRAELPKTITQADLLQSVDDTCLSATVDDF